MSSGGGIKPKPPPKSCACRIGTFKPPPCGLALTHMTLLPGRPTCHMSKLKLPACFACFEVCLTLVAGSAAEHIRDALGKSVTAPCVALNGLRASALLGFLMCLMMPRVTWTEQCLLHLSW